ncbi:MAG TPA: TlpA disulfide reductase family protein [Pyrinomonadaceae bacterium]|nr:TlpA disulfide reductase family protein [Pyrinomonadaceae bacterium]
MLRIGFALITLLAGSFGSIAGAQGQVFFPPPKESHKQHMKLLPVGEIAPNWQLNNPDGKVHSLAEYRGRVIVMDFWATWCGPCAKVMPRLQKVHEKLADKGVVVFGVNSWEKSDPIALMKQKGFSYELLLNGEQIADAYKVTTLPVVYIVGPDGKIIYCHEGQDQKDLSVVIEKYFKANGTPNGF